MKLQAPTGFRQPGFKYPMKIALSRRHFSVNRMKGLLQYRIWIIDVKSESLKLGFRQIKRANPCDRIHHFKLRYNLDIQYGFGSGFYQIMAVQLKLPFLTKR